MIFPALLFAFSLPTQQLDRVLCYENALDAETSGDGFWFTEPNEWSFVSGVADDGLGQAAPDSGPALTFKSQQSYQPRVRSPHSFALIGDACMSPGYTLELEAMQTGVDTPHRDLVLVFGFQSPERFYYAHLGMVPDEHSGNVFAVQRTARERIGPVASKGIPWGRGTWHRLRLECTAEGRLLIWFDGGDEPWFDLRLPHDASGLLGFGSFDDAGAFRNIKIWRHGLPRDNAPKSSVPEGAVPEKGASQQGATGGPSHSQVWHHSPFGAEVDATPIARGQGNAPMRVTGFDGPVEAYRVFVGAEEARVWVIDSDRDGRVGGRGDRWTFDEWGDRTHALLEDMLGFDQVFVTHSDLAVRLIPSSGSADPSAPRSVQISIPGSRAANFSVAPCVPARTADRLRTFGTGRGLRWPMG